MKNVESITISGQISGLIWMPCEKCYKEFAVTYVPKERHTPWTKDWYGLRDAVCDITNDGDFRGAKIDFAHIEVVYRIAGGTKVVTKELVPGKLIADCFN